MMQNDHLQSVFQYNWTGDALRWYDDMLSLGDLGD